MRIAKFFLLLALVLSGCEPASKGGRLDQIPITAGTAVIRTDFSDPQAWREIRAAISEPQWFFVMQMDFIEEGVFRGFPEE